MVLVYGAISGLIAGGMLIVTMPLYENGTLKFDNGMLLGYTTMVIALSLIFFAVKSYRDQQLKGVITFGRAFQVGILITLVASIIYALSWEVSYNTMKGDFMGKMNEHSLQKMKERGAGEKEMADKKVELDEFAEQYKNPLVRFPITIMEIAPVGLIVSLLCAALLRRKEFLPATS
jgi:hypothetical protein